MKWTLLFIIVLFSCNRNNEPPPEQPEISFDINGTHYSHIGYQTGANGGIGIFALKAAPSYNFAGYLNTGNFIQITITPPVDTLKAISYTQPNVFITLKAGSDTYLFNSVKGATVTSYQNGVVNGTFTGSAQKLVSVNPDVLQAATFSNGVIKNVKINY